MGSVIFGVVVAIALVVPTLLLSVTPCNDVVFLSPGEQAMCSAPGWAGRASVSLYPAENASAYLFNEYPQISDNIISVRHFNQTVVNGYEFKYLSYWLLNGSSLSCSVSTNENVSFFLLNSSNFKLFKQDLQEKSEESQFASLFSAENANSFDFSFPFLPEDDQLQQFFIVVNNTSDMNIDANFTTSAELKQFDVSNAVQSCEGEEICNFDDVSENQYLLTVIKGNLTSGITSVAMGWTYQFSVSLPIVIVIIVVASLVAILVITIIIITLLKTSKKPKNGVHPKPVTPEAE